MFADKQIVRMVASIRAMRTDNRAVDGLVVPVGWLAEQGINVQVIREPSPQNRDGSLARAGESFHNAVRFTSAFTALDERSIFDLPGANRKWSQDSVDAQVVYVLTKHAHECEILRQQEEKRAAWQQEEDRRKAAREQAIAHFFSTHGIPAARFRVGQLVATSDGLVWKIASKTPDAIELAAMGGQSASTRVVPVESVLVPGNTSARNEFHSLVRGIAC